MGKRGEKEIVKGGNWSYSSFFLYIYIVGIDIRISSDCRRGGGPGGGALIPKNKKKTIQEFAIVPFARCSIACVLFCQNGHTAPPSPFRRPMHHTKKPEKKKKKRGGPHLGTTQPTNQAKNSRLLLLLLLPSFFCFSLSLYIYIYSTGGAPVFV